jgi:SAM-dependent methyltransferase
MHSTEELKHIFQEGWNIPARVDNYVRNVAEREFAESESLAAWKKCLAAAFPAGGKSKILDVGTGPGIFACLYAQMGHECTGLDFSQRMLIEARRRAARIAPSCSFIFGDAENPPFQDDTFDVISSRHLLFNLPHPGVAVREWMRILKPGGKMILLGEDIRDRPGRRLRMHINRSLRRSWGRKPADNQSGWKPSPDYLKAVSQCPLFKHGMGSLQAVMEAVGLQDIRSHCTEEIAAARLKLQNSSYRSTSAPNAPFILSGRKPSR